MRSRRPIHSTHARVIPGFALAGLLLTAAACDREPGEESSGPQLIPTVGGQSGQEGSCLLPPVDALRFDAEATLGSVLGRHETKLRWNTRDEGSRVADGRSGLERASFELSARGGAHIEPEVRLACGGNAFLDVDVHMQAPDLDVTFEAVAQAWGAGNGVMISTTFDRAFRSSVTGRAKKLANDLGGFALSTDEEEYYFDMWLFHGFASGHLVGRHGNAFCGLAVWPETYCDDARVAMSAKDALGELDATELFDAISGIGEQSLEWSDGRSMRVRFEIEPDSGPICAGPSHPRTPDDDTLNGTEIELPVRVRAISDDGALDITVPGSVLAVVTPEHGFTGSVRMEASASTSGHGVAAGRVPVEAPMPGRALSVSLQAQHNADGDFMWLRVMSSVVDEAVAEVSPRDDASHLLICSGAPQTASTIDVLLEGVYGIQR